MFFRHPQLDEITVQHLIVACLLFDLVPIKLTQESMKLVIGMRDEARNGVVKEEIGGPDRVPEDCEPILEDSRKHLGCGQVARNHAETADGVLQMRKELRRELSHSDAIRVRLNEDHDRRVGGSLRTGAQLHLVNQSDVFRRKSSGRVLALI